MIKTAFIIMFTSILIQTVSVTCAAVLTFRYKIKTVREGLIFLLFNYFSGIITVFFFLEWQLFSGWSWMMSSLNLFFHIIAMYGLTVFGSRLSTDYLNFENTILQKTSYVIPPIIATTLLYIHPGYHYGESIIVIFFGFSGSMFVYFTIIFFLFLFNLIKRQATKPLYSVITMVLIICYLPLGIIDCFWPLFPVIHSIIPGGFSFSHLTSLALSLTVITNSFPFLVYHEQKKQNIKELQYNYKLTHREVEVLKLILKGEVNHAIARQLEISYSTVKKHVYSIFQKTGCQSRIELITMCRVA